MAAWTWQYAIFSITLTSAVLLALSSAVLGGVTAIPPDQVELTRVSRKIDGNDISRATNTIDWKPVDVNIVSDEVKVYKDPQGGQKTVEDVKFKSDNGNGTLKITHTVDVKPEGPKAEANEMKMAYSVPYVVFRTIGDGEKEAGDQDAAFKDGTSYIVVGDADEHVEDRAGGKSEHVKTYSTSDKTESEASFRGIMDDFLRTVLTPYVMVKPFTPNNAYAASNDMKAALAMPKELFTNQNEMNKNIGTIPMPLIRPRTFLTGSYSDYRSIWNPWGWQTASQPSVVVSDFDLLTTKISDMLAGAMTRELSESSSVPSVWCPGRERLSAPHPPAGISSPDLLWLLTGIPPLP